MKKVKCLFLILALVLPLCGCYDADEPNDIVYTVALGIDKGQRPGEFAFTIQFARPTQISGGASEEGGKGGAEAFGVITVHAPTIYSAINLANHVVSKRFILAHMKLIVFSEEVARQGVIEMADTIARSSDIRPNIYLCVARGKAQEYLEAIHPVVEVNPEKYYQLIFENEFSGYVPKNLSQNFYFYMSSNEKNSVLPLAAVAKGTEKQESGGNKSSEGGQKSGGAGESSESEGGMQAGGEDSGDGSSGGDTKSSAGSEESGSIAEIGQNIEVNYQGFEYRVKDYVAGNMDVEKQNKGEVMGLAVFHDDKMIGELNAIESELYSIASGQFENSYANFYSQDSPDNPTTLWLGQERKPRYKVDVAGDHPKIRVEVFLEADFISISPYQFIENDIKKYEQEVTGYTKAALEKFLERTARDFESDIVGFGSYAMRSFWTHEQFEAYHWLERYKDAEFEVDVQLKLRGTGLIIRNEEQKK